MGEVLTFDEGDFDLLVARVASCFESFGDTSAVDWSGEVRSILVLSSVPYSKALSQLARPALRKLVGSFGENARRRHLRVLGRVARFAVVAESTHRHEGGRRRGASTSERAASLAFQCLQSELTDGGRDFDPMDSVVMWVLASLMIGAEESVKLARQGLTREYKRDFAATNRWVSSFLSDRQRDIRSLTGEDDCLRKFVDRIVDAARARGEMDEYAQVMAQGPEETCWCSQPGAFVEQAWGRWSFARWQQFPMTEGESELLSQLLRASRPRMDVLVIADQIIALNATALLDSLLVLCVSRAGDTLNSAWHEHEVSEAVSLALSPAGEVVSNVFWSTENSIRMANELGNRHHDGEIDVVVLSESFLIDVQAKSSRSLDHEQRERLPITAAAEQHRRLSQTNGATVQLSARVGGSNLERRVQIGSGGLGQISITVGTEVVQGWSIGGGAAGMPPRILTTLDHLRIVNRFVAEAYRPAYWLDRLAQEFQDFRFIDEMDFLGKWTNLLWGQPGSGEVETIEGLALATDSLVEHWVSQENSLLQVADGAAADHSMIRHSELRGIDPASQQTTVHGVLTRALARSAAEGVSLSRYLVDYRARVKVENALVEKRSISLANSFGLFGVVFGSILAEDALRMHKLDAVLTITDSGGERFLEARPIGEQVIQSRLSPRWPAPSVQ